MIDVVSERTEKAIEEHIFPGCIIGIVEKNGKRWMLPFGHYTYSRSSKPIIENSIFDVASITKSFPTASLALKLIDEGILSVDDKLVKYLPEFSNTYREEVKVFHLLTHTLHYGFRLSEYKEKAADEILNLILIGEFVSPPGKKFSYSNAASILLGLLIEKVSDSRLDRLSEEYFFKTLGMKHTTFFPLTKFPKDDIVPTEIDRWRERIIQGEVHDESAYALCEKMVPGSAGLFSTVPDLLTFLEMLVNGGTLNNVKYFSENTVKLMYTNQIKSTGACAGLGWELNQQSFMGRLCSKKTFGKTGFTGCSCLCDMQRGIGIVILSNYTFPERKDTREPIDRFRREIADTVYNHL